MHVWYSCELYKNYMENNLLFIYVECTETKYALDYNTEITLGKLSFQRPYIISR